MTESHDLPDAPPSAVGTDASLWEKARAAAREDVRSVFKPREQTCPACGKTTETAASLCPFCRAPYSVKEKGFKITPKRAAIFVSILAALGIGAALVVPGERRDAARENRAARAKERALVAAEQARLDKDVRPVRASGPAPRPQESPADYRPRLLAAGQAAITANARLRMKQGTITGPVKGTECNPYPNTQDRAALELDPKAVRLRYECVAFERHFALPELEGKQRTGVIGPLFWLVTNYDTGALVFCKVTPIAGEGGKSLAKEIIPVPCRNPDLYNG
jgi:hypothetical protein